MPRQQECHEVVAALVRLGDASASELWMDTDLAAVRDSVWMQQLRNL